MRIDSNRNMSMRCALCMAMQLDMIPISLDAFSRNREPDDFLRIHWDDHRCCSDNIGTSELILSLIVILLDSYYSTLFSLRSCFSRRHDFNFIFSLPDFVTIWYWMRNETKSRTISIFILRNPPNMTNDHGLLQPRCYLVHRLPYHSCFEPFNRRSLFVRFKSY